MSKRKWKQDAERNTGKGSGIAVKSSVVLNDAGISYHIWHKLLVKHINHGSLIRTLVNKLRKYGFSLAAYIIIRIESETVAAVIAPLHLSENPISFLNDFEHLLVFIAIKAKNISLIIYTCHFFYVNL